MTARPADCVCDAPGYDAHLPMCPAYVPPRPSGYCPACGVDGHLGSAQRKRAHREFKWGLEYGNKPVGYILFRAISKDKAAFDRGAARAE